MLAPRKTLWSTPPEVVDAAIQALNPNEDDLTYDIGAGDGRFLYRLCELTKASCVGVEIDEGRCERLMQGIAERHLESRCKVHRGNALDLTYADATCFFLYLIPRGLKSVYRHILSHIPHPIRVVTYMAPLPIDMIKASKVIKVKTLTPEGMFPIYIYHMESGHAIGETVDNADDSSVSVEDKNSCVEQKEDTEIREDVS